MSSGIALEAEGAYVSRWKRYPAYRDFEVEWVGEVPEGWAVLVLRRLLDPVDGIKIGPFGSQLKSDIISNSRCTYKRIRTKGRLSILS